MSEQVTSESSNGRFNSLRDEALYRMGLEGWCGASSGDVASPYGFFSRITNESSEIAAIKDAFGELFESAGYDAPQELVGNWLIVESEQGVVDVTQYETEEELDTAFDQRVGLYESWAETIG
jgi:hypothetical protein